MSERFEARFEEWEPRVRDSFARQGAMSLLGAELREVELGLCSIALVYRPELSQQHGFFHAGVTSAIADSAGGYAAFTLFPAASEVLTVEFKINLIAPANGDELLASGAVVRSGRTLTVCTVNVSVRRNGAYYPCAILQQTLMRIDASRETATP
jgi:uncharacterized protein (TIGR00369 family)